MTMHRGPRVGDVLLESGIIDQLQLNTALKYQREWDRKLGEALVELGFISESVLVKVLSKCLNVPVVDLSQVRIDPQAIQKVPKRLADKYGLIPIELKGQGPHSQLLVAMIDPTNLACIDEIAFHSGCRVQAILATHSEIEAAIRKYYGQDRVVDVFFGASQTAESSSDAKLPIKDPNEISIPPGAANRPIRDKMVIIRGGEETTIPMVDEEGERNSAPDLPPFPSDVSPPPASSFSRPTPAPQPSPPSPSKETHVPANFSQSEESHSPQKPQDISHLPSLFEADSEQPSKEFQGFNWERVHPTILMKALIEILIQQGIFSREQLEEEIKKLSKTQEGNF